MYVHTQRSPMHLLLYLPATFAFFIAWQMRNDIAPSLVFVFVALLLFLLSISFQTLTISDRGEYLDIRYGPLNLFGSRIQYRDITRAEQGTTSLIDGWGVHFVPFRGWTINLWGFECVKIWRGNKVLRVGTDDSNSLVQVINDRIDQAVATGENDPV